MIYHNRYGEQVTPGPDAVQTTRRGIFAVLVEGDHILMTWQHNAIDTPQLPGGGIETGEDKFTALSREIYEEAGLQIAPETLNTGHVFEQEVGYFADDQQEFWTYHQTYVLVENAGLLFSGEKKSPEDGAALWVPIDTLSQHRIQAMHKRGIDYFLGIQPTI